MSIFLACTFCYILGAGDVSSAVFGFELHAINHAETKKSPILRFFNSVSLRLFMKQDFFGEEI